MVFNIATPHHSCHNGSRAPYRRRSMMNMHNRFGCSLWLVVGRAVLFIVSCALALVVLGAVMPKRAGHGTQSVVGMVSCVWAYALTLVFARWEGLSLEDVGAALRWRSLLRFGVGFAIGLLLVGASSSIPAIAGDLRWVRVSDIRWSSLPVAFFAYLLLSTREELAFRGYPLRSLQRTFGVCFAQFMIAVLFAAEHRLGGSDWLRALLGAGMGSLLFGMAAIATNGLAMPIGIHAAWNFGQWLIGLKEQPGMLTAIVEKGNEQHAEIVGFSSYLAVMGLATASFCLWHIYRRRFNETECAAATA